MSCPETIICHGQRFNAWVFSELSFAGKSTCVCLCNVCMAIWGDIAEFLYGCDGF